MTIRPAASSDRDALGRFGAALMRAHHAADPRRFILTEHPEAGYGRYLVSLIGDPDSLVMVAEEEGAILGYVYAHVENTSWRDLRGPCAYVDDVYVDETARRRGIGRELLQAAIDWAKAKGEPQVVLSSHTKNETAQRLFDALGFRRTMVEMTLDLQGGA
jgi:ribosomal protein S18 acetylase RimI-like enzyme